MIDWYQFEHEKLFECVSGSFRVASPCWEIESGLVLQDVEKGAWTAGIVYTPLSVHVASLTVRHHSVTEEDSASLTCEYLGDCGYEGYGEIGVFEETRLRDDSLTPGYEADETCPGEQWEHILKIRRRKCGGELGRLSRVEQ